MNETRTSCRPYLLIDFWNDALSSEQVESLQQHLSVCELCQSRFEEQISSQPLTAILDDTAAELRTKIGKNDAPTSNQIPTTDTPETDHHDGLRQLAARLFPISKEHPHRQPADPTDARISKPSELLGAIDHFDLLEPIGSGGMGFVYKAYDRRLHRLVALKVLSPSVATTGAARQRFLREAQAAATITSPYVVPIHAVSQIDGLPYLVMSLVDGPDLQHWITQHGPLPIVKSLRIAHQIATGLLAAHHQGVIHRDVKPANILIQPSILQAALTDFGLAIVADETSLTHSGMAPGTPSYMSPEQARGETIDARSDWYSFGCVLYTMLVGHPPIRGPHAMAVLTRLQNEDPKPPSHYRSELPPWVDRLVLKLLERRSDERLTDGPSIQRLLNDCVLHLENPNQHPLPNELAELPKHGIDRTRNIVISIGCLAVLAIMVISFLPRNLEPSTSGTFQQNGAPNTDDISNDNLAALQAEVLLRLDEINYQEKSAANQLKSIEEKLTQLEFHP